MDDKKKIIIIKLGAKGDVVRTLPILPAIKEKYPDSEIIWVTKPESKEVVGRSKYVADVRVLPYTPGEEFDVLYNFDIDEEAGKLASEIKAKDKFGFYFDEDYPSAFNLAAEYYLNTIFDDEFKKINKKTYQQMMFESAELEYGPHYQHPLELTEADKQYAETFIKENGINTEKLIGIHIGASPRWPSKEWSEEKIKEFITKAKASGNNVILFAGPDDIEKQNRLIEGLKKEGEVYANDPGNTFWEFASLVDRCEKMVCSDSLSLHVALALKKPTACLFFCTSHHEIEDYGILKKIISPKLEEFFPERMDEYDEDLVNSISVDEVLEAIGADE